MSSQCSAGNRDSDGDCRVYRPSISLLVSRSPIEVQRSFWVFYLGLAVSKWTLRYVSHVCVLLASVEEELPRASKTAAPLPVEDQNIATTSSMHDFPYLQEEDFWRFELQPSSHPSLFQRWIGAFRRFTKTISAKAFAILKTLLYHDPKDEALATQNLRTCLTQLRYCGGTFLWPWRAALSYWLWWVACPNIIAVGTALVGMLLWGCGNGILLALGWVTNKLFGSPQLSFWFPPGFVFMLLSRVCLATMPLIRYTMAFHTLRVLSYATSFSTNIITGNIWSSYLCKFNIRAEIENFNIFQPITLFRTTMTYTTMGYMANMVPYLMTRSIDIQETTYSADRKRRAEELIWNNEDSRRTILLGLAVWICLQAVFVLPSFIFLVRDQAQYLRSKELTVVGFRREESKNYESMSVEGFFYTTIHRVGWPRLGRMLVQLALGYAVVGATIYVIGARLLASMADADLVVDWFIRNYLDFALGVSFSGSAKDTFFWLYWHDVWSTTDGWGFERS